MTGPTVLAIEDESLILAVIEEVLTDGGYVVVTCPSGKDALRHLEESSQSFVALVTDIKFSGETVLGWDIARQARALVPTIGIVYMSGDSGIDWPSQGVPDSIFVQKPFASAQIVTAVSNVINSSGNMPVGQ